MGRPVKRRLLPLLLLAGAVAALGASARTQAQEPATPVLSASAYGISVVVPGQPGASAAMSAAPGGAPTGAAGSFAHPADGTAARSGALSSSVFTRTTGAVGSQAVADVLQLSLLNGEITADSVAARAQASAAAADAAGSQVVNLVLLGAPVAAAPNARFPLADWGYAVTLEQYAEAPVSSGSRAARASVTALHVVLTADHGGFPAGTEIFVGRAEVAASTPVEPPAGTAPAQTTPKPPEPKPKPKPKPAPKPTPKPPEPELPERFGPIFRTPPTDVSAPLSPSRFVFPVYGPSAFTDTFGAPRAGVGWHHGEDIFAPLGAPLLAVTDGTVFSVGWNDRGGYRLWLRDRQGNQFYYAHLSAFSPLAVNGNEVRAGDVVGFLGNTGDAQSTPYHLHFEIHPVGLLPLGYDGVVNAFPYLSAWRRLEDITFAVGRGWAPPVPPNATAPRPAAVLLGSVDISSASGLEPGSLERALTAPVSAEGDGVLIRAG
jgi:murein DD-endopeptidase MepM/ murein hydrolase activator NlpD